MLSYVKIMLNPFKIFQYLSVLVGTLGATFWVRLAPSAAQPDIKKLSKNVVLMFDVCLILFKVPLCYFFST